MNSNLIAVLAALAFLAAGCDKPSTPPTTNTPASQPSPAVQSPPPVQAEPFHGQVYKSLNGRTVLTLISKDECEMAEGRTTLLCKYSKQDGKLRVVTTALGTSQVVYFRVTSQGLEDNDGNVLLSPEAYAAALAAREREEQERKIALEQERLEKQRIAELVTKSKLATQTNTTFSLLAVPVYLPADGQTINIDGQVTLTDVSTQVRSVAHWGGSRGDFAMNQEVLFVNLRKVGDVVNVDGRIGFFMDLNVDNDIYAGNNYFFFKSEAEAQAAHTAVLSVFNAWKEKYSKAISK